MVGVMKTMSCLAFLEGFGFLVSRPSGWRVAITSGKFASTMVWPSDTTAEVEFAGLTAGYVTSDTTNHMKLVPGPAAIVDTFHLVKTQYGWRIESPQLPDWVSGYTVVQQADTFRLRPGTVDSIKAFLARSGV